MPSTQIPQGNSPLPRRARTIKEGRRGEDIKEGQKEGADIKEGGREGRK